MSFFNNLWYEKSLTSCLLQLPLLPFSGIFGLIAAARRSLYANGFRHTVGPVVPVVVIGGITVGGTGKTPICVALVKELQARGFNPGVLTRGYKSHCNSYPCQVPLDGDPYVYGDEPSLIRRATKAPVVIDPQRTRGADYLAGLGVDVIITDDGLQHYALDRDVEVCVLDGSRMLGNGHLLPAGPLREAKWRLKTVDSIVVSGAVAHLGYYPMMLKPSSVVPLSNNSHETLQPRSEICAFSGIGNPSRFYKTLEDCGYVIKSKVDVGDHGKTSIEKLKKYALQYPVVMTAKDAIKYKAEATEQNLGNIFVLNVQANLSKLFYDDVVNKIKQSTYRVAQRRKKREAAGYVLEKVEMIDHIEPNPLPDADYRPATKTAASSESKAASTLSAKEQAQESDPQQEAVATATAAAAAAAASTADPELNVSSDTATAAAPATADSTPEDMADTSNDATAEDEANGAVDAAAADADTDAEADTDDRDDADSKDESEVEDNSPAKQAAAQAAAAAAASFLADSFSSNKSAEETKEDSKASAPKEIKTLKKQVKAKSKTAAADASAGAGTSEKNDLPQLLKRKS